MSSSFFGGLMHGLQQSQSAPGMDNAGTSPLYNAGLGLLSAASPHLYVPGNVGEALSGATQATMQNRAAQQSMSMNALQMQMLQAKIPGMQAYYNGLTGLLGGPPNPQGGAAPPTSPTQGPMTAAAAPTGDPGMSGPSMPNAIPQSMPNASATPQSSPSPQPSQGLDPLLALRLGTLGAAYGMPGAEQLAKYPESLTAVQKAQQTQRQIQSQGPMGVLDTIATAPNADKIVTNNAQLLAQYAQIAPQLGFDPTKAPTAQEAQTYARFAYNQMAGSAGLPTKEMPHPLQSVTLKDGRTAQIDPITHKETVIEPSELQQVVGPNGTPILVPKGQAAGMQPFNATIFGAGTITDQSKELAYQQWKATGSLPTGLARNPVMNAAMTNYISMRAQQEGIPGVAAAAQHQAYQAQQGVLKDFTSGATNRKLVAINTGVAHLDALNPLIDAMETGNLTLINKAQQLYQKQTGKAAPTNYSTLANMAVGEVSQAVMSGGGTGPERDELGAPFKSSNGPDALRGAVKTAITALAGKTDALRNSWEVGTNGTQGDFNRFLVPATKRALGIQDTPAAPIGRPGQQSSGAAPLTNAQGWTLHQDAKGNMAYVSPDGKQFQEVK